MPTKDTRKEEDRPGERVVLRLRQPLYDALAAMAGRDQTVATVIRQLLEDDVAAGRRPSPTAPRTRR